MNSRSHRTRRRRRRAKNRKYVFRIKAEPFWSPDPTVFVHLEGNKLPLPEFMRRPPVGVLGPFSGADCDDPPDIPFSMGPIIVTPLSGEPFEIEPPKDLARAWEFPDGNLYIHLRTLKK